MTRVSILIFAALCVFGINLPVSGQTWARVGSCTVPANTTGTSIAATRTATAGNLVVAMTLGEQNSASTITLTHTAGFSYSAVLEDSDLTHIQTGMAWAISDGTADTVTFHYSASETTGVAMALCEYSNTGTLTQDGAGSTSHTGGGTVTTITVSQTSAGANELAVAVISKTVGALVSTSSSGWNAYAADSSNSMSTFDNLSAGSGSVSLVGTWSGGANVASGVMLFTASAGSVGVSINAPTYGFNVLAGSVRTISAIITNGIGNLVNWTVSGTTGGATASLSASTNALPEVTVTLGATSGTCTINGTGPFTVTSTATVTIQAQSVDDVTKTATTVINVCNPAVQIAVVPFYRTLYAAQKANLQSYIIGNTNLNVTWAITSQPGGGNGTLDDTTNRDTVFSATVAGRYTLTATSVADGSKTATAIMYVSGNAIPSYAWADFTEPVDCTVDPALSGTTYEVGPARAFTTIQSVPLNTAPAGSTVRIHNDGTPGNPTVYHEYFQITTKNGTASQPIRVVGCPATNGEKPIVDGQNATGASWVSSGSAAGYGIASIAGPAFGNYQGGNPTNAYDIIEGLHLIHASPSYTYTPPAGGMAVAWVAGASCINVRSLYYGVFLGNDIDTCSNGVFSDANMNNNGWAGNVLWADWEGNHIHAGGISGSFSQHQFYVQGWGQLIQFNRSDLPISGMVGANLKSRGIGDVIRYNYFGDGYSRELDLVELQDSSDYETIEGYLSGGTNTDAMGPNVLAGWQEAYHNTFVYGNIIVASTSVYEVHFSGDQGGSTYLMAERMGTLNFCNNTMLFTGVPGNSNAQVVFDTSGGTSTVYLDYPNFNACNNIFWTPTGTFPYWQREASFIGTFTTNLMKTGTLSIATPINGGSINANGGNGWSNDTAASYQVAIPLDAHMTGISAGNFLTTSTQPFDSTTYAPPMGSAAINAGTALSGVMAKMPVRFQMNPSTGVVTARAEPLTIGAMDSGSGGGGGGGGGGGITPPVFDALGGQGGALGVANTTGVPASPTGVLGLLPFVFPSPTGAPTLTPEQYSVMNIVTPFGSAYRGLPYAGSVVATGGVPPYTLQTTSGILPFGISLAIVGNRFNFSGTPTGTGSSSFTLQATDSKGNTSSLTLTITVYIAASVAVTPGSQSIAPAGTLQMGAAATMTNGAVLNVRTSSSWASTAGATVGASTGLVTAGGAAATPSITAVFDSITSPGVTVTVTGATTTAFTCAAGDDTAALQAAINTAAGALKTLEIKPGTCRIGPIFFPANSSVQVDANVTVNDIAGYGFTDRMLNFNSGPATLIGAGSTSIFRMTSSQTQSAIDGSEYRHCIGIGNENISATGSDILISGIACNQSGGDGAQIDSGLRVTIQNSLFDHNRRDGLSITGSVNHLKLIGNTFSNNLITLPKSGIDIEPNHATDFLLDISMQNNTMSNNPGDGLFFSLQNLTSSSMPVDITVSNNTAIGNGRFGYVATNNDPSNPGGTILIQNSSSTNDGSCGAAARGWQSGGTLLSFQNLTVNNPHVNGPDPSFGTSAAVCILGIGGTAAPTGNVSFTGTNISVTNGLVDHYCEAKTNSGSGFANLVFDSLGSMSGASSVPPNCLLAGAGKASLP
jgi:hypothetical protein